MIKREKVRFGDSYFSCSNKKINAKSENEFQQNSKTRYILLSFFLPFFCRHEIFAETRNKVRTGATFFPAKK